ncbi:MAG TPA: CPBP family intramembrane glutamic endopeptidase, partial [Flavobacteriaceae bacterium]|nr:CPBP family intramembrane glutamic endopeptidase [Flavobacteriaceae bacterium]
RDYLIKDTIAEWNKSSGLQKLLEHDISFSSPEVALNSYRRMQEESYFDDFLGIKRLKIFFKDPFNAWTISELSHIIILVLLIAFLFLIPYIWILPIYSSKKYFKLKTSDANNLIKVDWSLKHFWLISFMYLLCQLLLVLIFYYEDYINFIFDISYSSAIEETLESEIVSANTIIVFCILLLLCTLLLLNRQRLKFVLNSNIRYLRIITLSIAFVIFNAIILKILGSFVNLTEAPSLIETLSIREELKSLISQYGLALSVLIAAVAVPFYEEIIFRGIILSSTEKHVGFKWANGIQATLFAIVHFNLNLFIFYFIFGLVTGYAVKRTNGLLTGIAFHAVNNFLVLLAIYYISKLTLQI